MNPQQALSLKDLQTRYPYQFNEPELGVAMAKGWVVVFAKLCADVDQVLGRDKRGFHWSQVKEKFGSARFYFQFKGRKADLRLDIQMPGGVLSQVVAPKRRIRTDQDRSFEQVNAEIQRLEGIRVAGLGGHFVGRVWMPPSKPLIRSREEALSGGSFRFRGGQRPSPTYLSAIYPAEVGRLTQLRADILVTHEAPSCHPHGHTELDMLARSLQAQRMFHGHHHDDRTAAYALQREQLGFDTIGLRVCAIKNGLGEVIFVGEKNW